MRRFLATQDIGNVYRLLQKYGMSQRAIAARTGQAQSEVSEVMSGRRVVAYQLLLKIVRGFGLPRGWLGLEYDEETRKLLAESTGGEQRPTYAHGTAPNVWNGPRRPRTQTPW
jgi:transcriptional regulator with XRE-family HTH domain